MPPAVAGVAALAVTVAASTVVSSTIALAAISLVTQLAFTFIASALNKPQQQGPTSSGQSSQPTIDNKVNVKQAAAARPVVYGTARIAGVYADMFATNNNGQLHVPILYVGHEIEAFTEIWINDEIVSLSESGLVVSGKYAGFIGINQHLGSPDQIADASLVANSGGRWTAADRLRGIAYLYVVFFWKAELFAGALPNVTVVVKGKKDIYDPVTATTGWTANAALCQANYLTDTMYGLGADYDAAIDEAALIVARNLAAEDVDKAGGGTEKRYECNGAFLSSEKPRTILGRMIAASHGRAVYDGDRWRIHAAGWVVPDFTLTQDHLRGEVDIQVLAGIGQNFNAVKGTYVGPANKWQVADFPPLVSQLYKALDGGETSYSDFEFKFVSSPSQCQRLAKIDLLQSRQQIRVRAECKLSVWQVLTGDNILAELPRYGWEAKPFEVMGVDFAEGADRQGNPIPGVDLLLRETAQAIFDWTTSEESTVDPAPNTSLPSASPLPPSNLRITESLYQTREGGGAKAKATATWDASPDAFVTSGGHYLVQHRPVDFADWITAGTTTDLTFDILDVAAGTSDYRVFAVNYLGVPSTLPVQLRQAIAGLAAPPASPTGFTVSAENGVAIAHWNVSADLDVREGGRIVFRHSPLTAGATWAGSFEISGLLPGNAGSAVLPLKAGTYLAKFVDASGVYSVAPATFAQGQSSVLTFVTAGSLVEDPAFAGVRTGVAVLDGALQLDDSGDFDSVPDVDAMPNFDYSQGVAAAGSYAFAATLDLGAVEKVRLTALLQGLTIDVFDDFDSRAGEMDDWPDFDGAVAGNEGSARVMVRHTSDDPAGSPAWSAWEWLHASDFQARAFQARLDLASTDSAYSPRVTDLSILAEAL